MVELEFPLTDPRMRKQSLTKIDLLAEVINRFRDAVHSEAALINKQSINQAMINPLFVRNDLQKTRYRF